MDDERGWKDRRIEEWIDGRKDGWKEVRDTGTHIIIKIYKAERKKIYEKEINKMKKNK